MPREKQRNQVFKIWETLLNADILQLRNLNRKFDVIECVGTLHHMKDPLAGLKEVQKILEPHGVLKLGLYSAISRRHIVGSNIIFSTNPNSLVNNGHR